MGQERPVGDIARSQGGVPKCYVPAAPLTSRVNTMINLKSLFLHELPELLTDFSCPVPPVVVAKSIRIVTPVSLTDVPTNYGIGVRQA